MTIAFDPYHKWLGIPPAEQPPHHYRLLGIALFESDPDVIDAAADQRMTFLRACASGAHIPESQKLLNEVATARLCLLNAKTKAAYDSELKKRSSPNQAAPAVELEKESPAASPVSKPQNQNFLLHRNRNSSAPGPASS